ncbi:MAG: hypothetical protein AB4040_19920 [Synechococcus sp.]
MGVAISYRTSVRSFFGDISWDGDRLSLQSNIVLEERNDDWRCASLDQFFHDIDWQVKQKKFVDNYLARDSKDLPIANPMTLPVGRFFHEFGRQSSTKYST